MRINLSDQIAAPPARVFAALHDEAEMPRWMDGLERIEYPAGKPAGNPLGARFRARVRQSGLTQDFDGEITAFEADRRLGIRLAGSQLSIASDFRLAEAAGGTRLDYTADVEPAGLLGRLAGPMITSAAQGVAERQLAALKRLCEAHPR